VAKFRNFKRLRGAGKDSEYSKGFVHGAWLGGAGVLLGLGGMLSVAMAYGLGGAPRQAPRTSKAPAIAQAPLAGPVPAAQAPAAVPAAVPPAAVPVAMAAPAVVVRPAVATPRAVSPPAAVTTAAAATTATCPDSVVSAALNAFDAHLYAAHLQRSPLQQLADILSTDQYVKTHTVLAQNMLQGLFDAISGACSGAGAPPATMPGMPGPSPAPTGPPVPVKISQLAFSPASVTVPVGGTVIWTNSDPEGHTVTSMGKGPLGSATLDTGGTYSYTFTTPGIYMYYCAVHPDMMGMVVVSG
jgi:plastocyanin